MTKGAKVVTETTKLEALNRMADFMRGRIDSKTVTGQEDWFKLANITLQNMAKHMLRDIGLPNDPPDVEDVISDLYRKVRGFRPRDPAIRVNFRSFIHQLVVDRFRKKKREITTTHEDEGTPAIDDHGDWDLDAFLREKDRGEDITTVLASLLPACLSQLDQRDYVAISLWFGFSTTGVGSEHTQQQIAKIIGISQQAVSNRIKAAMQQLRECIEAAKERDQ